MKRTNATVLLIIAVVIIIIGGGLYWAQKTGRISLFAAFDGWPDVTPDDPAYEEMMAVGEKGWLTGYPDGYFYPDANADRAQGAIGAAHAAENVISPVDPKPDPTCDINDPNTWIFTDVPCDHWAYNELKFAKELGFIDGYPDGSFQPDRTATRAELVVFMVKAKGWDLPNANICTLGDPSTYPFPDVPCDHWAYDYIVVAKQQRIIFGYESGEFKPEQGSTRRDLAVLMYRSSIQAGEEITISGNVSDSETGLPIPGATVNMIDDTLEGTQLLATADSTGAYRLRIVARGGYSSAIFAASGYNSSTIAIPLDIDREIDVALSPISGEEGVISGAVKDSDTNAAISGASVAVLNYENGSQLLDTADSNGAYELRVGATSGTFSIRASATGYDSKTLSATLSGGSATLNFLLTETAEPEEPGEPPIIVDGVTTGGVVAAATGAILPVALVLLGTILALFSLIYLLKTNKPEKSAQA